MDEISDHLRSRLANAAQEILRVLAELGGDQQPDQALAEEAIFPPEAEEKVRKRLCLQCPNSKPPVAKGARYVRGLCSSHETETREMLDAKRVTERELIVQGLYAPAQTGGRPKKSEGSALEQYLANRHRRSPKDADDLLKEAHAKSRKAKKSPPSKSSNPDQKSHDAPA